MIRNLFSIILTFIFPLIVHTQVEEVSSELLFTIGYNYFPQSEAEEILAAKALEYHQGHLFLAFMDKVLILDLQGNVISIIYPPKTVNIWDIVFYQDQLVMLDPQSYDKLSFYQDQNLEKSEYVNFSAQTESDLSTPRSYLSFQFSPRYLINVGGDLYFHEGRSFFPYSGLKRIKVSNLKQLNGKEVLINSGNSKLIFGYPISDCESFWWTYSEDAQYGDYSFAITDFCDDSTSFFPRKLPLDSCSGCLFSKNILFKNEYLTKYFFLGVILRQEGIKANLDQIVIFLDDNFEVEKICHNFEYLQDNYGDSPSKMASFTYDELGNVYYCTNYLDRSDTENSYVKIFKISYADQPKIK